MSLAIAWCRGRDGVHAPLVTVEAHLSNGLPAFSIVGLPEAAVRESRERIRSAIINSGYEFPRRRLTVNLAPAELPKDGGRYDLAIALALLAASGQLPRSALEDVELFAELALDGGLRGVSGVLPAAIAAGTAGRRLVVSPDDAIEASFPESSQVYAPRTLSELCEWLRGGQWPASVPQPVMCDSGHPPPDLADVVGQAGARRALEVAAAGGHNLLLSGPPGAGKSLLAVRLPGLLPPLALEQALETASIHSLCGQRRPLAAWYRAPLRAPHHSSSAVALVGGGSSPRPGEISLAHNGVLFLDELPEFDRRVLEVLREPLESGSIHISRAARQAEFPARFQLVAAMNPCPCGYLGDPERCRCGSGAVERYRARISGPLLDRIDLQVQVPALPAEQLLSGDHRGEASAPVRHRVAACRAVQQGRQGGLNAQLAGEALMRHCRLAAADRRFLSGAMQRLGVSARGGHRLLRIARTLADLEGRSDISRSNLLEALALRTAECRSAG